MVCDRPPRLRRFGGFAPFYYWRTHPSCSRRGTPFPAIHSHLLRAPLQRITFVHKPRLFLPVSVVKSHHDVPILSGGNSLSECFCLTAGADLPGCQV